MLLRIVAIVFPVFALIGAGYGYARLARAGGGVDMAFANRLNMEVFVPALVFSAMASKDFHLAAQWRLALAGVAVVLGSGLLTWPLARLLRAEVNTFVPPMMFNNSGNMGLPLTVLAFGEASLPAAVVLFFASNTLHYSLGTWMLDHHARLWTLWRVPVIGASLAGALVSLARLELWAPLLLTVKMLGDVSIPLLLFSLGVRLTQSSLGDLRLGLVAAAACPLSGMAVAWAAAPLLGLTPEQRGLLLVFGALPPAVLNFVFAERYRQEPEKVASIVMVGNLGALVFVPVALALVLEK